MKYFVIFCLIAATLAEPMPENGMLDFLEGFFAGIHETGKIEDIKECIKEAEHIFEDIKKAIELIKTLKIQNVIEGVTLLIKAIKELGEMLKPCIDKLVQLKKLIEKLKHLDIKKIAMKIITHPGQVIAFVHSAINCFAKKDFKCAGKAIGDLLYLLVLTRVDEVFDTVAFLTGFLEGLGETEGVEGLLKCIGNIEEVIEDIKAAINEIIKNPANAATLIISLVIKIYGYFGDCADGYKTLKMLIEKAKKADVTKIIEKIKNNAIFLLISVYKIYDNFNKDWKEVGAGFGEILKIIFF